MSFGARLVAGYAWTGAGRILGQLVTWIVSILIVRLLSPEDYGLLAIAVVLTGFVALVAELGLGSAVIQAKEVDRETLRRVFGLVILVNGALFGLIFCLAPLVGVFFAEPRVVEVARVAALTLLITAPGVIPDALLQRDLNFKWRSIVDTSASLIGAALTLALALGGWGVWALVYGPMLAAASRAVGLHIVRPFLEWPSFSVVGMRGLFGFGGHVAVSRALLYVYLQADVVIVGRMLGKEQLGYYSVAMQLASIPLQRVSSVLNDVAFPAFSRLQDDAEQLRAYLVRSLGVLAFLSFPVFWGIAAVAPEIVALFLGQRWQPATLPLQLLALIMPLRMVGHLMPPTLQAVGKAGAVAVNHLLACFVLIAGFTVGAHYGIVGVAIAWLAAYPVVFALQLISWLPITGIRYAQLLWTLGRPAVAGATMFGAVAVARHAGLDGGPYALSGLVAVGAATYLGMSLAINSDAVRAAQWLIRRARAIQGAA